MKELLKRLEAAVEIGNKADEAWENEPENKELEAAFTKAYNTEYRIREELAAEVVTITKGKIDMKTALHMTYDPKLAEIIGMMA